MMATRPGSASPQPPTDDRVHDAGAMCRYPSKKCYNQRAVKRNGELHNLCDLHRQKANKNQRRLELKRKARAQAADAANVLPTGKRVKQSKKPRARTRRAPLSATLAMQEEARAKRLAATRATPTIATSFLQDLVLLDGVYDRTGFLPAAGVELQGLGLDTKEDTLDRILLEGGELSTGLEMAKKDSTEGKTSPMDVGESWEGLDFSDYWLTPADQPAVSLDASAFVVDDDVLVADV